jgi:hypothetical protein
MGISLYCILSLGSFFLEMITSPGYKLATVNRQAAALDSRLIRFAPLEISGSGFA